MQIVVAWMPCVTEVTVACDQALIFGWHLTRLFSRRLFYVSLLDSRVLDEPARTMNGVNRLVFFSSAGTGRVMPGLGFAVR